MRQRSQFNQGDVQTEIWYGVDREASKTPLKFHLQLSVQRSNLRTLGRTPVPAEPLISMFPHLPLALN